MAMSFPLSGLVKRTPTVRRGRVASERRGGWAKGLQEQLGMSRRNHEYSVARPIRARETAFRHIRRLSIYRKWNGSGGVLCPVSENDDDTEIQRRYGKEKYKILSAKALGMITILIRIEK